MERYSVFWSHNSSEVNHFVLLNHKSQMIDHQLCLRIRNQDTDRRKLIKKLIHQ